MGPKTWRLSRSFLKEEISFPGFCGIFAVFALIYDQTVMVLKSVTRQRRTKMLVSTVNLSSLLPLILIR